ncbi:M48 family metalloprotease [Bdellovibrio bacteriovorus]|nr:M48 family metalloprotease [Bdellovibrio bacteriovorus]
MRYRVIFVVKCVMVVLMAYQARASVSQYVSPDYYLGQLVLGVLKVAAKTGYPQYREVDAPDLKLKVDVALKKIYKYPAYSYRYDNVSISIIEGLEGEPNGFGFGNNIFLTKSLVRSLSLKHLTAVIAHELAHLEKSHNMQRAPLPITTAAYQLKNIYESVKAGTWPRERDLVESMQELLFTSSLAMELQADCIAAKQLEYMNRSGLLNSAEDLNGATSALMGFDITTDQSEDPSAIRARALLNKSYEMDSCDIF